MGKFARFAGAVFSIACGTWAVLTIAGAEQQASLLYLKEHLLKTSYDDAAFSRLHLQNFISDAAFPCNSDAQIAFALIDQRLAAIALTQAKTAEFDARTSAVRSRISKALACAPRQPFLWLLRFADGVLSGKPLAETEAALTMSYKTGPRERWIGVRRIQAAMPLADTMSKDIQDLITVEFGELLAQGFAHETAVAYSSAPQQIKSRLDRILAETSETRRREFAEGLKSCCASIPTN